MAEELSGRGYGEAAGLDPAQVQVAIEIQEEMQRSGQTRFQSSSKAWPSAGSEQYQVLLQRSTMQQSHVFPAVPMLSWQARRAR